MKPGVTEENIKATLMVRGIDGLDYEDLQKAFAVFGRVKEIRMVKDRFTSGFKNFAFVEFESEKEADLVIEESLKEQVRVAGRPVNVVKSKERKVLINEKAGNSKKETERRLEKEASVKVSSKGREMTNEVFLSNLNGKLGKYDEATEIWSDRLKQSIALCFKCQKWFDTIELGKLHDICHG